MNNLIPFEYYNHTYKKVGTMKKEEAFLELFKFTRNTFYVWKRENRPIIKLIEKYFSNDNIKEFLETEKIKKFENDKKSLKELILEKKSNYSLEERVELSLILLSGLDSNATSELRKEYLQEKNLEEKIKNHKLSDGNKIMEKLQKK